MIVRCKACGRSLELPDRMPTWAIDLVAFKNHVENDGNEVETG